jgi:hypothetical protein
MAGQSSNFSADAKNRWLKLARTCSILEHEAAENRVAPRASRTAAFGEHRRHDTEADVPN